LLVPIEAAFVAGGSPAGAADNASFCAAVQTFNASPLTTQKEDVIAGLQTLEAAAPRSVRTQLVTLRKLVRRSRVPSDVLQAAQMGKGSKPAKAGAAGDRIDRAVKKTCQTQVDFADRLGRDPTDWAAATCGVLASYRDMVKTASDRLDKAYRKAFSDLGGTIALDPTTGEAAFADTLKQIGRAVSKYTSSVISESESVLAVQSSIGIPSVDQGANIRQFVLDQYAQSRQTVAGQQDAVGAVSTEDVQAGGRQLDAILAALKDATVTAPSFVSGITTQFPTAGLSDAFANAQCPS